MDRPVSKKQIRKVVNRRIRMIALLILIPIAFMLVLKYALTLQIVLSKVTVETADLGNIQISVQGSGVVIPNYEEVITSPFRSNVVKINKLPGAKVNAGDTLLELNNESARIELKKSKDELELKLIQKEKLKIKRKESVDDFEISRKIKEIRIENLKWAYDAEVYLNKRGGSTLDVVRKAKTEWDINELELKQAINRQTNQLNSFETEIRELETEIRIQNTKISEALNRAELAYVKAPFSGDLSSVINQPGAMVSEGQEVARVADFSRYRLKGIISNSWAGKIRVGQPVQVRNQDKIIDGTIVNIIPSVSEGMIECLIRINDGDITNLRPNQQLDLRVIISFKDNILLLPNLPYYKNPGEKYLYVIKGNKAYRTKVLLGEASFESVEVISGLQQGDQVILTDLAGKYEREEIRIK